MPMEPLCTMAAIPPRFTASGSDVPKSAVRPAKFRRPRQFGPHTAMPFFSAKPANSFCSFRPAAPASPKPLERTVMPPTRFAAACLATSSTLSAFTATNTASISPSMAARPGWHFWPSSSPFDGFTRWTSPWKPTCSSAFQALEPGPILSEAPTMAMDFGLRSFSKPRFPFFRKGGRTLVRIRMREHHFAELELKLHHVVPAAAQVASDGLARGADRRRRGFADAARDGVALVHQLVARHDLRHQAHFIGFPSAKILADQEDVERLV